MTFDNIVFAGGGNRCFWQAGFWQALNNEIPQSPTCIASVSAGSAISCALFSGCFDQVYETTLKVMTDNKKNRYWKNLFKKGLPIHPHNALYRYIIANSINDDGLQVLKQGPENRILVAHIPTWLGPKSATLVGLTAYQLEKRLFHPVHPKFGSALGFTSEFRTVQSCQGVSELSDLILSSSCTPPFTPLMYQSGKAVLDGGMIDNIPFHGVSGNTGKTLILCSRPYKKFPQHDNTTYVAPSVPVPVKAWDYTNPGLVKSTFLQGKHDAELFLRQNRI